MGERLLRLGSEDGFFWGEAAMGEREMSWDDGAGTATLSYDARESAIILIANTKTCTSKQVNLYDRVMFTNFLLMADLLCLFSRFAASAMT